MGEFRHYPIRRASTPRANRVWTSTGSGWLSADRLHRTVAAYDAYRMAAEALLIRQGLRATGGEGSHVTVEDAISGQFAKQIPGFAKSTFRASPPDASRRAVLRPVERGDQRGRRGVGAEDFAEGRRGGRAVADGRSSGAVFLRSGTGTMGRPVTVS